jgi:lysophospholipase L1-like esterase
VHSRARSIAGRIALLLASVVVTLLALEGIIRLAGVPVGSFYINRRTIELDPNPQLQFRLRPGAIARAEVDYLINERGLRGPDRGFAKAPGTRRIVVSGDSIAFGYWVAVDDAYPAQIEALLRRGADPPSPVEVVNLGVPGYNLGQEFEFLQTEGLRYDPDLVILSVCLNDLDSIFSYEYGVAAQWARQQQAPGRWTRAWQRALSESLLAAFIEYRLTRFEYRQEFATQRFSRGDPETEKNWDPEQRATHIKRQRRHLRAALRTFATLLRKNGDIPAIVALFPGLDYDFDVYPHAEYHRLVAEAAAASGLPFVDLLGCYRGYPPEALAVDPVHPSPLGHRVAAHAIVEAIADESLLDVGTFALPNCGAYRPEDFPTVRGY